MPGFGLEFELKGFLDNRAISNPVLPLLGNPFEYVPEEDDWIVVALSDPGLRKTTAGILKEKGARFFSVIHPQNLIGDSFVCGEGLILAPYNSISNRVTLGDFVSIYGFCKIGHDIRIGSFCHIASHCSVDGFSSIPENQAISSYTKIFKNTVL